MEPVKCQSDDPSLVVVLADIHAPGDGQRLFLCEDGCSRVSFLFRIIPVLMVAWQVKADLPLLQFGLLETENIRIRILEEGKKPFVHTGTQAVYIPGYQFFHKHCPFQTNGDFSIYYTGIFVGNIEERKENLFLAQYPFFNDIQGFFICLQAVGDHLVIFLLLKRGKVGTKLYIAHIITDSFYSGGGDLGFILGLLFVDLQ